MFINDYALYKVHQEQERDLQREAESLRLIHQSEKSHSESLSDKIRHYAHNVTDLFSQFISNQKPDIHKCTPCCK